MTKIIITAVMALVSFLAQAQVSEFRKTGSFSKIEVESGIELIYSENSNVSIKAEAENEKDLRNLVTEVKGKTLRIYYATENKTTISNPLKIYVNANTVDSFKAVANAKIIFKNSVKSEEIQIDVASGASFNGMLAQNAKVTINASTGATFCGQVETDYLSGNFKTGATISLSGKAKKAVLNTSSGSFCTAKNLASENATINARELSSVLINGRGKINANAESGSSITYFGKPKAVNIAENSIAINNRKHSQLLIAMD